MSSDPDRTVQVRIPDPAVFHALLDQLGGDWRRTLSGDIRVAERPGTRILEVVAVVPAPGDGWMLWWLVEPDVSHTHPLAAMGACIATSTLVLVAAAGSGAGGWSVLAALSTMVVTWAAAVAVLRRGMPDLEVPAAALGEQILGVLNERGVAHEPSLEPLTSDSFRGVRRAGQVAWIMVDQAEEALREPEASVSLYPTLDAIEDHSRRSELAKDSSVWEALRRLHETADADNRYDLIRMIRPSRDTVSASGR
jgi:hypothetical protein